MLKFWRQQPRNYRKLKEIGSSSTLFVESMEEAYTPCRGLWFCCHPSLYWPLIMMSPSISLCELVAFVISKWISQNLRSTGAVVVEMIANEIKEYRKKNFWILYHLHQSPFWILSTHKNWSKIDFTDLDYIEVWYTQRRLLFTGRYTTTTTQHTIKHVFQGKRNSPRFHKQGKFVQLLAVPGLRNFLNNGTIR